VSDETGEGEIRKRAAWLLVMLAVVALLFAALMITVLGSNKGHTPHAALGKDPIRSLSAGPHATPTPTHRQHPSAEHGSAEGSGTSGGAATGTSSTSTGAAPHSCPTPAPCALDGDIGNAIAAVNAYRTAHGKPAVPGTVSPLAQKCAASNGSDCSGGWAESPVPTPDGQAALDKVLSFAHDLNTMKSFEIGWAYNPAGHDYLFAIVQNT
jgi:hypothetical protein